MKTLAKTLLIVSCVLALAAMFSAVQEANATSAASVNGNDDGTYDVTCKGTSVDEVVALCKETFLQVCPEGGKVLEAIGSPLDARPLILMAKIKCNPSKVI